MRWYRPLTAALVGLLGACSNPKAPLTQLTGTSSTTGSGTASATTGGGTTGGTASSAATSTSGGSSGASSSSGGSSSTGSSTTGGRFSCNLGDGGLFASPLTFFTDAGPSYPNAVNYPLAVGDFDHDGNLDIALATLLGPATVGIFFGNGDGSFRSFAPYDNVFANPDNLLTVSIGSPSHSDLVVVDFADLDGGAVTLAVTEVQSDGSLTVATSLPLMNSAYGTTSASVAYLSDGRTELFVSTNFSCETSVIDVFTLNDGGWLMTSVGASFVSGNNDFVGDFNEDGIPDVVAAPPCGGGFPLYLFPGNSDGTFADSGVTINYDGYGNTYYYFVIGDLNEDGHLDILMWGNVQGWSVVFGNGNGAFTSGPAVNLGTYYPTPPYYILQDLNGDGHLDFIGTTQGQDGYNIAVIIALGNGDGTFQPAFDLPVDAGVGDVAIGDVNNDGRPDLVTSDIYSQSVSVFLNNCR